MGQAGSNRVGAVPVPATHGVPTPPQPASPGRPAATNSVGSNAVSGGLPPASVIAARFPAPYSRLNYTPFVKADYPANPRRDVKGLYVTLYSAASANLDSILRVVDQTPINALVIDVKDDRGHMLYQSKVAERFNPRANEKAPFRDGQALVQRLKSRDIYLIARIVTFKDPTYAEAHPGRAIVKRQTGKLFRSSDGLAWGSPYDSDYRAYNLEVAREAARMGFNEIQFDYIRFPEIEDDSSVDYRYSSGQTKPQAIQSFLIEARRVLTPLQVYLSADVFGLVTTVQDDMDIGQYWEAISTVVDYISPMAYPSHYAPKSYGIPVPDLQPYELMSRAVRDGLRRNQNIPAPAQIRPWIQAFTAKWLPKYRKYGVPEIRDQVRALREQGVTSYLVWNPNNRYTDQQAGFH